MAEGLGLLARNIVRGNLLPASLLETSCDDVLSLLEISQPIHGRGVGSWDSRKHPVGGCNHVGRLPSGGEVVVPIDWVRLPPQRGIDCGSSSENATCHLIDVVAGNTGGVNPDLVAKTRNIKASEVGACEPGRLHCPLPSARRRRSALDKESALSGLGQFVCYWNATGSTTNYDIIVGPGRDGDNWEFCGCRDSSRCRCRSGGSSGWWRHCQQSPFSIVGLDHVGGWGTKNAHTIVVLNDVRVWITRGNWSWESLGPCQHQYTTTGMSRISAARKI